MLSVVKISSAIDIFFVFFLCFSGKQNRRQASVSICVYLWLSYFIINHSEHGEARPIWDLECEILDFGIGKLGN